MIASSVAALGMISLIERSIVGDIDNSKIMQGNYELEASYVDQALNNVNPKSMDDKQE